MTGPNDLSSEEIQYTHNEVIGTNDFKKRPKLNGNRDLYF